jgi:hypothetical protein
VNKVNHRKEFFRLTIADLKAEIEKLGLPVTWTMAAEAREYRETLAIERAIDTDPEAKQKWLDRQLELDPTEFVEQNDRLADIDNDETLDDREE